MSAPICIIGMPSGGTSVVAGILRQLGVDMGFCYDDLGTAHECRVFMEFLNRYWSISHLELGTLFEIDSAIDFLAEYTKMRRGRTPGPWGVKAPWSQCLMHRREVDRFGFRYVRVDRPLEKSITSWWVRHPEKAKSRVAAWFGMMWGFKEELFSRIEPAAVVSFEQLMAEPGEVVMRLAEQLELNETAQMIDRAVETVDPQRWHVR